MNKFRYILDKGSKKFICPQCQKKTFVKYIDTNTGNYLGFGRCDREVKCGYHSRPSDKDNIIHVPHVPVKHKTYFIPKDVLKQTLQGYEINSFTNNLKGNIKQAVNMYLLGTIRNGYRKGAVTFPFIDINMNVRAVQVKQFDKSNHTKATDFIHSIIEKHHKRNNTPLPDWLGNYLKNDKKITCLFGEHLLNKYPNSPIALVEAPKTAVICSLYFGLPDRKKPLWLSCFNLTGLNYDKVKVLKNRDVILYPDLSKDGSTFELWSEKAKQFNKLMFNSRFKVSDYLETNATQKEKDKGLDLADFINN